MFNLSWLSVLKAEEPPKKLNWNNRILYNNLPSTDEIKNLDAPTMKNLDTTIDRMLNDLKNLPIKKPSMPEGTVQLLHFGSPRRKVKRHSRGEIQGIIDTLLELKDESGITNPMLDLEYQQTKYSDMVSNENKTDKTWTKEVIDLLIEEFINNKDIDHYFKLFMFLSKLQENTNSRNWRNTYPKTHSQNPETKEKLQETMKSFLAHPEATENNILARMIGIPMSTGKKTREILAPSSAGTEEKETSKGPIRAKKRKVSETEEIEGRTGLKTEFGAEESSPKAYLSNTNLVENMKLSQFRTLMKFLHTSEVTKNTTLQPYKERAADILWDISIRGAAPIKLNEAVTKVDLGRKGFEPRQRTRDKKTDFAVYYVKNEIENKKAPFKINTYELQPKTIMDDIEDRDSEIYTLQMANKERAIDYIKGQVDKQEGSIYNKWLDYIRKDTSAKKKSAPMFDEMKELDKDTDEYQKLKHQIINTYKNEGLPAGDALLESTLGTTIQFDNIVDENFNIDGTAKRNIFGLLFLWYYESNSKEEFTQKVRQIIPLKGVEYNWVDFIPQGKLFADSQEESFIKSWRTIITILKDFRGKEVFSEYNLNMEQMIDNFYDNLREALEMIGESLLADVDEDKEYLISQIGRGILTKIPEASHFIENQLGIKENLKRIYRILYRALLELEDFVVVKIHDAIKLIGEDTSNKYTKHTLDLEGQKAPIQDHLIKLNLLELEEGEEE